MNIQGISYAPGQSDYSSIVSAASSAVSSMQSSGKTGVIWITFTTEAQNMFQHAASDSTLTGVSWFGIDDLFASAMLPPTVPTAVGQAEVATNFTVSSDYIVGNPTTAAFFTAYKQACNKDPISYAETFYDGVWLAALDILYSGGVYNGTVLLQNIDQVANHYVGVDGQTYLDANGDQALGYFGFDQVITNSTGGYVFSNIGYYDGSTPTNPLELDRIVRNKGGEANIFFSPSASFFPLKKCTLRDEFSGSILMKALTEFRF